MASLTHAWEFLDEWFRALKGSVRVHETGAFVSDQNAVRLGRDDGDELWIEVVVHDGEGRVTDDDLIMRCRLLHEALLLTSVVAVADYDAWCSALDAISELGVPDAVDTTRRLQPQYRVRLASDSQASWAGARQILASEELSERFQAHYAMAVETAARFGVAMTELAQRFRHNCGGHRSSNSAVFLEVLTLVETGVILIYLGMPFQPCDDMRSDGRECHKAWAFLVCAVCGVPQRPTRGPSGVQKFAAYSLLGMPGMALQLLTVLRETRSLKAITIAADASQFDPHGLFWLWFGYALFYSDSICSANAVTVKARDLSVLAMDNLRELLDSNDPLSLLWQKTTRSGPSSVPTARRVIVVPAGTSVRPYFDDTRMRFDNFVVPANWSGVVIDDDPNKTSVDILLHGIGFCAIDRDVLPNKRRRVERVESQLPLVPQSRNQPRASVQTLLLELFHGRDDQGDEQQPACGVDVFLGLIGAQLTSLSISDSTVDDERLARCLKNCPLVENLRLCSSRLTTMEPIIQSVERGGKISSIDLPSIQVQPAFLPRFEAFLNELIAPTSIKRTLKRLRIGHHWSHIFRQSTGDLIKQVLEDPLTLDFLHVYRCENPRAAPPIDWDIVSHQREIIPAVGTPRLALRVAFASVVRHLRSQEQLAKFDDAVMGLVFEYVGRTKQRVVISEVCGYYNSRMYGAVYRPVR